MNSDLLLESVEDRHCTDLEGIETLDPEIAAGMQGCFLILSLLFRYPETEVYQRLEEYLKDFDPFFEEYTGRSVELIPQEELQAEYIRLFVNSRGFVPVVPYASYHCDSGKLLGGATLDQIRQLLGKAGFVLDENRGELEDHVAVLLECCSWILMDLSRADPAGSSLLTRLQILRAISYDYLRPVSLAIDQGIRRHAGYDLYRVVGETLQGFFQDLDQFFAGLLEPRGASQVTRATRNPQPATRNPQLATRNAQLVTRNPQQS